MGIMNIITNSTDKIDVVKSPVKATVVGSNAEFVGNITFSKTLQISGTVKGNITATEEGDAKVIVDDKGLIEGDVVAPEVLIEGEINGNVRSTSKIIIAASALITGNVYYDILEMQGGATVNGSLIRNMGKTAGLLEKQAESNNKPNTTANKANTSSSFLQSIDKKEDKK